MSLFKWIPAFLIAFSMTLPVQFAQAKSSGKTGKKAAADYMKASGKSKKKTVSVTKKTKKTVTVTKKSKSKKQAAVQKKSNGKLAAKQVNQKRNVASSLAKSKMKNKVKKNMKKSY